MTKRLSHTEVWRLKQLLFMLYRDIVECDEQIEFEVIDNPNIPDALSIIDINERISSYQNNPPSLPFEDGLSLPLDQANLLRLRSHIMDNENLRLAIDLIDPYPNIKCVIDYIEKAMAAVKASATCLDYLKYLERFIDDLRAWTNDQLQQRESSLTTALLNKKDSSYLILTDYHAQYGQANITTISSKTTNSTSDHTKIAKLFKSKTEISIISGIYQNISILSKEQPDGYIAVIDSIITIAFQCKILATHFKKTLKAVYEHFGIDAEYDSKRPAGYYQPGEKGNLPDAYITATEIMEKLGCKVAG